ncbi:MAG: putative lipid II flippase FtsW [Clostridiales bacterium]|nr:putative lipid II flippase FtsW [Clostridiales bacterium]
MRNKSKVKESTIRPNILDYRFILISLVIVLCVIGIIFIYSASNYSANVLYGDSMYFVTKQIVGFVIGLALMMLVSRFNYHNFARMHIIIVVVSVVMLVLVFVPFIGMSANGANRWIGFGPISIQSSEVAKFGFVIFASVYMAKNYQKMYTFNGMLPVLLIGGMMCLLVLMEPNLSVTICLGLVMLSMLYIGGVRKKYFVILLCLALLLVPVLIIIEPYRLFRLFAFINPWANPQGEGFQLIQSLYSLGAGGLFGVGLFNSMQKYLFLPFAESDFILAIIGEETGLVGVILLFAIYLIVISIGYKIALNAKDRLGTLLAFGITTLLAFQTLINVAVVTGSIPPTGIPLPFISAGGSGLIVFMCAIGILLNIAKNSKSGEFKDFRLKGVV